MVAVVAFHAVVVMYVWQCFERLEGPELVSTLNSTGHTAEHPSHYWCAREGSGQIWCNACNADISLSSGQSESAQDQLVCSIQELLRDASRRQRVRAWSDDEPTPHVTVDIPPAAATAQQDRARTVPHKPDAKEMAFLLRNNPSKRQLLTKPPPSPFQRFMKSVHTAMAEVTGTMPLTMRKPIVRKPLAIALDLLLNAVPRSVSQVVFANNSLAGVLAFFAVVYPQPIQFFWCCLLAVVVANITAVLLGLDLVAARNGLCGYNAVLVGLGIAFVFDVSTTEQALCVAAVVILGSAVSVVLTEALANVLVAVHRCPPFTMPFNLILAALMLASANVTSFRIHLVSPLGSPKLLAFGDTTAEEQYGDLASIEAVIDIIFQGIGQVYFAGSILSGILLVIALALYSPICAIFAVLGSAIGALTGMLFGASAAALRAGLWGYNPVLGCIAMGGVFHILDARAITMALLCGFACAVTHGAVGAIFTSLGIPALTFPFVLTTYLFMLARVGQPIPLSSVETPGSHLSRKREVTRQVRSAGRQALRRFGKLYGGIAYAVAHPPSAVADSVSNLKHKLIDSRGVVTGLPLVLARVMLDNYLKRRLLRRGGLTTPTPPMDVSASSRMLLRDPPAAYLLVSEIMLGTVPDVQALELDLRMLRRAFINAPRRTRATAFASAVAAAVVSASHRSLQS